MFKTILQPRITEEQHRRYMKERENWALYEWTRARFLFHLPTHTILDLITIDRYRCNPHEDIYNYHQKEDWPSNLDDVCVRFDYYPNIKYAFNGFGIEGLSLSDIYQGGFYCNTLKELKELVSSKLSKQDLDSIEEFVRYIDAEVEKINNEI